MYAEHYANIKEMMCRMYTLRRVFPPLYFFQLSLPREDQPTQNVFFFQEITRTERRTREQKSQKKEQERIKHETACTSESSVSHARIKCLIYFVLILFFPQKKKSFLRFWTTIILSEMKIDTRN